MLKKLQKLEKEAMDALASLQDSEALHVWNQEYLGKKGALTPFLRGMGQLPPEERPKMGRAVNQVKLALVAAFEEKQESLREAELAASMAADAIDVTLPGRPMRPGRLHISTQTLRRIYKIFGEMGFQVYEAPDVETDEHNFELLNMTPYHPARDMWDTFWVESEQNVVLRTHTSPGQVRVMREHCPEPIRVILPGKCYRYEQITARSEHQFYQVEGLAVGRGITMTDLIGTATGFARKFYGAGREVRIRGSYFPFTEPSVEVDMDCNLCGGEGCRVCKYSGWLEIAGAGMVHPVVLRNGGYDPAEWSGFAFGFGVERPALVKYAIDDIRLFYSNDLRFLRQF